MKALVIAAAIAATLFVVFRLALRHGPKASVLASLVVVGFFYYGFFYELVAGWGLTTHRAVFPLWTALFVLGVIAVLRTKSNLTALTRALTAFAVVLTLISGSKIVTYRFHHHAVQISDPRLWLSALQKPAPAAGSLSALS